MAFLATSQQLLKVSEAAVLGHWQGDGGVVDRSVVMDI